MTPDPKTAPLHAEIAGLRARVAELEGAEGANATALRFLDAMDRVSRVLRRSDDLDQLLMDVLDEMLDLFGADRAWLLYPCDPDSPTWSVPMERTRAAWPGAFALGVDIPMGPDVAPVFHAALTSEHPLAYDYASELRVPNEVNLRFSVQAQLLTALHPPVGKPWMLGIHHCAGPHLFTPEEVRVFAGLCTRVQEALGTMLVLRDLRESERRFRTLTEHAPEAILVLDPAGRFVEGNPNAARLLKRPREGLVGLGLLDVSPPRQPEGRASAEGARVAMAEALAGGEPRLDWTFQDSTGKAVPCEMRLVLLQAAPTPLLRASILDITERLALQGQLLHLQKMEAVGELAGGIAHDFNNQLLLILLHAELLYERPDDRAAVAERAERIMRAAEAAAGLTRELLAFSRRALLVPEVVDLIQAVSGTVTMLRRAVGSRIELTVGGARGPAMTRVDPQQLDQVVVNLVTNARDAMPNGGHIRVSFSRAHFAVDDPARPVDLPAGPYVSVAVTDDGSGMDAAVRARIFEPFFTTKERGKGTGLGLSTAYGVVRQSGGTIEVESTPGAGSTFRVYLPEVWEAPLPARAQSTAGLGPGGAETVLVVDDNEAVAQVAVEVLRDRGYRVLCAGGGAEALELVERGEHVDLLLTDLVMPGIDGVELSERLQARLPGVRSLFVSGYGAGTLDRFPSSGPIAQVLRKPYALRALVERVRSVLDEGRGG